MADFTTVFLSSTAKDLQRHRDAVYNAIHRMVHFHCLRMEEFVSQSRTAEDACRKAVLQSDVIVGLIGHLHGSRLPGSDLSYTELEVETAKEARKPILLFLAGDNFPLSVNHREPDHEWELQQDFRKRLPSGLVVDFFEEPEALATKVVTALHQWREESRPAAEPAPASTWEEHSPILANDLRGGLEEPLKEPSPPNISRTLPRVFVAFLSLVVAAVSLYFENLPSKPSPPSRPSPVSGAASTAPASQAISAPPAGTPSPTNPNLKLGNPVPQPVALAATTKTKARTHNLTPKSSGAMTDSSSQPSRPSRQVTLKVLLTWEHAEGATPGMQVPRIFSCGAWTPLPASESPPDQPRKQKVCKAQISASGSGKLVLAASLGDVSVIYGYGIDGYKPKGRDLGLIEKGRKVEVPLIWDLY